MESDMVIVVDPGLHFELSSSPGVLTLSRTQQQQQPQHHHQQQQQQQQQQQEEEQEQEMEMDAQRTPSLSPWPLHIDIFYGFFNGVKFSLPLRSDDGHKATYKVGASALEDVGLLSTDTLNWPWISVRVIFSGATHAWPRTFLTRSSNISDVVVQQRAPFAIVADARPRLLSSTSSLRLSTASSSSSIVVGRSQRCDTSETGSAPACTNQTTLLAGFDGQAEEEEEDEDEDELMQRGAFRASAFLDSDISESGWGVGCGLRQCILVLCSPCFSTCFCLWHVLRSTPKISLFGLGIALAAVLLGGYNSTLISDELRACGLHLDTVIYDAYHAVHAIVLLANAMVVVLSALLKGLTKEFFCGCINSGILEYRGSGRAPPRQAKCYCCASCLRRYGMCLIWATTATPVCCLAVCGMLIHCASGAAIVARLAAQGCDDTDYDDSEKDIESSNQQDDASLPTPHQKVVALFDLANSAVPYTNFDSFDPTAFCSRDDVIREHLITILTAAWILLAAQALFFSIMVDNRRVAHIELTTRAFEFGGEE